MDNQNNPHGVLLINKRNRLKEWKELISQFPDFSARVPLALAFIGCVLLLLIVVIVIRKSKTKKLADYRPTPLEKSVVVASKMEKENNTTHPDVSPILDTSIPEQGRQVKNEKSNNVPANLPMYVVVVVVFFKTLIFAVNDSSPSSSATMPPLPPSSTKENSFSKRRSSFSTAFRPALGLFKRSSSVESSSTSPNNNNGNEKRLSKAATNSSQISINSLAEGDSSEDGEKVCVLKKVQRFNKKKNNVAFKHHVPRGRVSPMRSSLM